MWHEHAPVGCYSDRGPHHKLNKQIYLFLLSLLLVLDACAPAKNEERQATPIMGNVVWSDSEGNFLQGGGR